MIITSKGVNVISNNVPVIASSCAVSPESPQRDEFLPLPFVSAQVFIIYYKVLNEKIFYKLILV